MSTTVAINGEIRITKDARLKLRATPEAAAEARAFTEETLIDWALHDLIPDGKLIVSELISNSIVATPGDDVRVLLTRELDTIWICVWDSSTELPEIRVCGPDAESGRGMHIVAALADANGAFRVAHPKGKLSWARLTI